jgi:2-amino-4-hydroxy-6-hydroxymethyldihydropteridine diphosphokinase
MPRVYVSLGSNIDREKNLRGAVHALRHRYAPLTLSSVYETRAVGFEGDNFYNLVVGFDTEESVETVRQSLARVETDHGRKREGVPKFSARTLDLDILLYGDLIRHDGVIEVPRDEIVKYAFVLQPLAEIASATQHPETGESIDALWKNFTGDKTRLRSVNLSL